MKKFKKLITFGLLGLVLYTGKVGYNLSLLSGPRETLSESSRFLETREPKYNQYIGMLILDEEITQEIEEHKKRYGRDNPSLLEAQNFLWTRKSREKVIEFVRKYDNIENKSEMLTDLINEATKKAFIP